MKYQPYPYAHSLPQMRGGASFTQGFVASACLSAFQDVNKPCSKADYKRILRQGLQGGTALAAGARSAVALRHGNYTDALLSVAIGAAGVLLLENLLKDSEILQENSDE
ncbi:hypothetical protein GO003_025235 [Methylicorpusculum oleiharenae]|uniref:hypothetical protein n=1 Tax=Methylicorpusculum oleiharenae TaxID=1338687 RepID=UPI001357AD89|nr:hypothetical protein [Methylicorpusculum oleiharenae]MCD2453687.1 hypothetical protein [Methylicorpusculum oleiharenae]